MDGRRFDELTRRIAGTASRRNFVRGLIGGAAAMLGVSTAGAAQIKRTPGQICRKTEECVAGTVCGQADATGRKVCTCVSGKACGKTCIPSTACCTSKDCPDDGKPCTGRVCVNGACGFKNEPAGSACDDGDPCTVSSCQNGACQSTPIVCADCLVCSGGACVADAAQNGTTCDDGNACTTGDACMDGVCAGTAVVCGECEVCSGGACVTAENGAACADGKCCKGACIASDGCCTHAGCDDGLACTVDICGPVSHTCGHISIDLACVECADDSSCGGGVCCGGRCCAAGATCSTNAGGHAVCCPTCGNGSCCDVITLTAYDYTVSYEIGQAKCWEGRGDCASCPSFCSVHNTRYDVLETGGICGVNNACYPNSVAPVGGWA
jgi:hypothetical protein